MKNFKKIFIVSLTSIILNALACNAMAQYEFEKGDCIYKRADDFFEKILGPVLGIDDIGHAALYRDWNVLGTTQVSSVEMNQHRVIEMQADGMNTERTFQRFIDNFWGAGYYVGSSGLQKLSDSQRRAIIATALTFTNAEYGFFANDAWIYGGYKDPDHNPPRFRCDGLVEYCYEIALGHNWKPGNNGGIVPNDTYRKMWPALQFTYLEPRTLGEKPIIEVKDSLGNKISKGDFVSNNNVIVEATDGSEGSGLSRLEVWKGLPGRGGTEIEFLRNTTRYNVDHTYPINIPSGEIYIRVFDQAGNESLFNLNVKQTIIDAVICVFRPNTQRWYIDLDGNGTWSGCGTDRCLGLFGAPGDLPVAGDWDNTGFSKIGVYRPGTGMWYLDNGDGFWSGCGTDMCLGPFGAPGDLPIAGDWTNTGTAKIGVYRPSTRMWYLDNGDDVWSGCGTDFCIGPFGSSGDLPIAGDWTNTGTTKIGVYRPSTRMWYLDNGDGIWSGFGTDIDLGPFGSPGDLPVAGVW